MEIESQEQREEEQELKNYIERNGERTMFEEKEGEIQVKIK